MCLRVLFSQFDSLFLYFSVVISLTLTLLFVLVSQSYICFFVNDCRGTSKTFGQILIMCLTVYLVFVLT